MHDIDWNKKLGTRQDVKSHIRKFLLYPAFWEDTDNWLPTGLTWKNIKFKDDNFASIPNVAGVYCFVVIPPTSIGLFPTHYLFYIGKAEKLRARYKIYINERNGIGIGKQRPRIKVQEMLNLYYEYIYFYYIEEIDIVKIIKYENGLLDTFMPYVNTQIPRATISEELKHIY